MARHRSNRIWLNGAERESLEKLKRSTRTSLTVKSRIKVILAADENQWDISPGYKEIGRKAKVSEPTVKATLDTYIASGIEGILTIHRNEHSDISRKKVDGKLEAKLISIACSEVPTGRGDYWKLSMIQDELKVFLETNSEYEFNSLSVSTISRTLRRNELRPHLNKYWCIPPEHDSDFVAAMEDVLEVYQRPYNSSLPVWCMDEKPFQLLDEAREPIPMKPGQVTRIDDEYVRCGTACVFCFIEPLTGRIHQSVQPTRTAVDWADQIKYLVDNLAPEAEKIILVMDNLNTHVQGSLYRAFPPEEAQRIRNRLEIHYTPVHGSWLDMAEIGIHVMTAGCLGLRIPGIATLREELDAWETKHNQNCGKVKWQFTTKDARTKLKRLYPDYLGCRNERDKKLEGKLNSYNVEASSEQ